MPRGRDCDWSLQENVASIISAIHSKTCVNDCRAELCVLFSLQENVAIYNNQNVLKTDPHLL